MGDGIRASPILREPSIRDFYKAGFLKYLVNLPKDNKVSPTPVRYWTIFSVINDTNPVLEFFSEKPLSNSGSSAKPTYIFSLKRCLYLCPVPVIEEKENCFEFIITLDQQSIHLIAPSRQSMEEWIDCIKTKLKQMNILAPQDNYYAKEPVSSVKSRLNQRSNSHSTRPLPPIPLSNEDENNQTANQSTGNVPNIRSYSALTLALMVPVRPPRPTTVASQSRNQNSTENSDSQPSYEPIFVSATQRLGNISLDERMTHLPPEEGPPPYEDVDQATLTSGTPNQANASGSLGYPRNDQNPLSLRESQIFRLKREIVHKDGVRVLVRKQDCNESIALVDWLGKVWVAGWKQKTYPQLHNTFHIGDRIMSVCGEQVHDSAQVLRLIRSQSGQIIELIIRRIPHGFVFVLKREFEGQDLGIVRDGNTAEVIQVVEGGLASAKGLRPKAMSVDQSKNYDCNWIITEINNRPLNLFFKGNEIRDRLNAVGKDISILFQPSDLIKVLKKRLKSFKNYKDYIVQ